MIMPGHTESMKSSLHSSVGESKLLNYSNLNLNTIMKDKKLYFAPECEEADLCLESVIATSSPEYEDGGLIS